MLNFSYKHTFVLLVCFGIILTLECAHANRVVAHRGATWTVEVPPGFRIASSSQLSFVHKSGVNIVIQELSARPIDENYLRNNVGQTIKISKSENIEVNGMKAIKYNGYDSQRGLTIFAVLVEGKSTNGVISAQLPDISRHSVPEYMIQAVLMSALERQASVDDRLSRLPFKIGNTSGMHLQYVILGRGVVFAEQDPQSFDDKKHPNITIFSQKIEWKGIDVRQLADLAENQSFASTIAKEVAPEFKIRFIGIKRLHDEDVLEFRFAPAANDNGGLMWIKK